MSRKPRRKKRRIYSEELKAEAVQMLLDGHSAESVVKNLGLSGPTLLYRWKAKVLAQSGPAATSLESRVRELEEELRRVERERDILPLDLSIVDFTFPGSFVVHISLPAETRAHPSRSLLELAG